MQSIEMEVAMSSTQLTTAAPIGRELASSEIDGMNDRVRCTNSVVRRGPMPEVC
jgi:hypothetical protein